MPKKIRKPNLEIRNKFQFFNVQMSKRESRSMLSTCLITPRRDWRICAAFRSFYFRSLVLVSDFDIRIGLRLYRAKLLCCSSSGQNAETPGGPIGPSLPRPARLLKSPFCGHLKSFLLHRARQQSIFLVAPRAVGAGSRHGRSRPGVPALRQLPRGEGLAHDVDG